MPLFTRTLLGNVSNVTFSGDQAKLTPNNLPTGRGGKVPPWVVLTLSGEFGVGYYLYSKRPMTTERKEEMKEKAQDPRRAFEEMAKPMPPPAAAATTSSK